LPYAANYPINKTLFWNYVAEPEPFLANLTYAGLAAQVLGGGSIVNGMAYDRGSVADFDAWEALGNKGWSWSGIYPFYKKGVEFIPPPADVAAEFNMSWDPTA